MVCPRAVAVRRPQEANLAEMIVNLQCRLEVQECEMQNLHEQLAQQNQELPPPPAVPTQPAAPAVPAKDAYYWWKTMQMRRNVLEMTWNDFIQEFNDKFYNQMAMKAQQNEFNNIKQGSMSVTEAVRKFDQLA
ncbi:hypothetical protein TIFTF001_035068 [Ficus carica]|uniref:Retrotransposon gag domain-containing protein n=1 Tax=Ficus carica TaxID=3494 RepID=A0AA88E1K3_FICCA|nr:hypothetical protein TIFTF001_035068 [Ficus carica]